MEVSPKYGLISVSHSKDEHKYRYMVRNYNKHVYLTFQMTWAVLSVTYRKSCKGSPHTQWNDVNQNNRQSKSGKS